MGSFYDATVELGVANQVTTFTASDFGRTFTPNAGGTDHGWGNQQLIMGGTVQGGNIYGKMPSLAVNSDDDTGRGRWIPTTSVDEYNVPAAIVKSCISGDFDLTFARVSIFLETSSKNSS